MGIDSTEGVRGKGNRTPSVDPSVDPSVSDPAPPDPSALKGLGPETRARLRELALRALDVLGVHAPSKQFVSDEMVRQFTALAPGLPGAGAGGDREAALLAAIARELEELDER